VGFEVINSKDIPDKTMFSYDGDRNHIRQTDLGEREEFACISFADVLLSLAHNVEGTAGPFTMGAHSSSAGLGIAMFDPNNSFDLGKWKITQLLTKY